MADYDSSLPVRTEADGDVVSQIAGSTVANIWDIDANGIGQVNLNDGTNSLVIGASGEITVTFASGAAVEITDGSDTLEVNSDGTIGIGDGTEQLLINTDGSISSQLTDGTDALDINSDGSVTAQISDGTDALDINSDGSINVNVVDQISGDEVHEYGTVSAGVPGTENTVVDYTVSASRTLQLKSAQAAGSGKFKAEIQVGPSGSEVTQAVWFGSTSNGFGQIDFPQPIEVATGDKVLLLITNRDKANADVYGFINGVEIA